MQINILSSQQGIDYLYITNEGEPIGQSNAAKEAELDLALKELALKLDSKKPTQTTAVYSGVWPLWAAVGVTARVKPFYQTLSVWSPALSEAIVGFSLTSPAGTHLKVPPQPKP